MTSRNLFFILFDIKSLIYFSNIIWQYYSYFSHHEGHQNISHVPQGTYIINKDNMKIAGTTFCGTKVS